MARQLLSQAVCPTAAAAADQAAEAAAWMAKRGAEACARVEKASEAYQGDGTGSGANGLMQCQCHVEREEPTPFCKNMGKHIPSMGRRG